MRKLVAVLISLTGVLFCLYGGFMLMSAMFNNGGWSYLLAGSFLVSISVAQFWTSRQLWLSEKNVGSVNTVGAVVCIIAGVMFGILGGFFLLLWLAFLLDGSRSERLVAAVALSSASIVSFLACRWFWRG